MSKTRIAVRVLLVLLILVVSAVVYRAWSKSRPNYYWDRAQAATRAGDQEAALLYLQNLLAKHPEHGEGHAELSRLLLEEARAEGQPAQYATHPRALHHLQEAARLRRDDAELQKRLLRAYLSSRRLPEAAAVATRLSKSEPDNADVLFARLWRAVDSKNVQQADELIARLQDVPTRHAFQSLLLTVQNHEIARRDDQIQQALDQATNMVDGITAAQFDLLSSHDREAMFQVMLLAVEKAATIPVACQRATSMVTAGEKLFQEERLTASRLAEHASRVMTLLDTRRASISDKDLEPTTLQQLADLSQRIARSSEAAISTGEASALVYRQAAVAALERRDYERAITTLREGIASTESLADGKRRLSEAQQNGLLDLHLLAARQLIALGRFADAQDHLTALLRDPKSAGWGQLLAGSGALNEGRLEKAHGHFIRAQRAMGNTLMVRMALADTHLALQQWKEALPYLASVQEEFDKFDDEQRAWAERHLGSRENVAMNQLRARLALGQWEQAQPHLDALKQTAWEPRASGLLVSHLWSNDKRQKAYALMQDVRRRFPQDAGLLQMEVAILQKAGEIQRAEATLSQFVANAPDDLQGHLLLCAWQLGQGQVNEALRQLDALPAGLVKTEQDRLAVAKLKTQALLIQGKSQEALALLETLSDDPRTAPAMGVLAAIAATQEQDLAGAAQSLAAARLAAPSNGLLGLLQGELAAQQGDHEQALANFETSLDVTALRDRARMALMRSVLQIARDQGAAAAEARLAEFIQRYPHDPILAMGNAELQFQQGRFAAGMQELDRAERLRPDDPAAVCMKAAVWLNKNEPQSALTEAARALKLNPQHLLSLVLATQASLATEQFTAAVDYAAAALEQNPQLWQVTLMQAAALQRLTRVDEAIEPLTRLTETFPELADGYAALAKLHFEAQQLDRALAACRAGRQHVAAPQKTGLLALEVSLLAQSNRAAEAQQIALKAMGTQPQAAGCLQLAQAFMSANHAEGLRYWCRQALRVGDPPMRAAAHLLLGNLALQESAGNQDQKLLTTARDHFAEVVQIQPNHVVAANNLAWLLTSHFGEPEKAVRICEQVLEHVTIEQVPIDFVDTVALAYRQAGQLEKSRGVLVRALKPHPEAAKLHFQLGMTMAAEAQNEAARSELQRALKLGLPAEQSEEARKQLAALSDLAATLP